MRCLLVEDERQVREGMARLVPWAELGFGEVLTASNGLEALELLAQGDADLIISDVRMARMNGVQLLEAIRREGCETPFLFISGFSDKEYLMAAIRYHAVDYLEKPVMISELTERVRAIVATMRRAPRLPTARALLEGNGPAPALFAGARRYWAAVLTLAEDGFRLTRQQIESAVFSFHRATVMEEESLERTLLLFAEGEEPLRFGELIGALNHAGGGYALCVGPAVEEVSALGGAYAKADICSSRAFFGPMRGLHFYQDRRAETGELARRGAEDIARCREARLYCQLPALVERYAAELPAEASRADALSLLAALAEAAGVAWDGSAAGNSWRAARERLVAETGRAADALLEKEAGPTVARAVRYIAAHLDGEMPVSAIAAEAFVSPSYLNALFTKQMGRSVKQYITDLRIERAKGLLAGGAGVQETARAVGLRDGMYFSKLFKRRTGVSPSEFSDGTEGRAERWRTSAAGWAGSA